MQNTTNIHSEDAVRLVPNGFRPFEGVVTGGQPSAAELERASEAGVRVVVDTRGPSEPRGFDEPEVVGRTGMEYVNIPVEAGLADEAIDRLRQVLRDESGEVLIHCASGNRVGGLILPHLVLDRGMSPTDALETALNMGLQSQVLAHQAMAYIARNNS